MHLSEQKFNVYMCETMRLDESYRLVTTVAVLNSHYGKIYNIFLTTIAAAAQSRHSYFSARRGGGAFSTVIDIYATEQK
jgi:hypothetical protein